MLNNYKFGFINLHCSCYANSAIQLLLSSKELVSFIIQQTPKNDSLALHLQNIIHYIFKQNSPFLVIKPTSFMNTVFQTTNQFKINVQEDAHDFLLFLMDNIHESFKERNKSIITETFDTRLNIICKCKQCGWISTREESCRYLSVDLKSASSEKAISDYLSNEEIIDKHCDKCNCNKSHSKTMTVLHYPKQLLILVNRFNSNMTKNHASFTIDRFIFNKLYEFSSCISHMGSIRSGHYSAARRMADDSILVFDDETFHQPQNYLWNSYVVLYERKK